MTGGSQGLGLALALLLAKKGAHVSIVARNQKKLDDALALLEVRTRQRVRHQLPTHARAEAARTSDEQTFHAFSFSLTDAEQSAAALKTACGLAIAAWLLAAAWR